MLHENDFSVVGQCFPVNPSPHVAHSMVWFQGRLYLGLPPSQGEGAWDGARILRYDPASEVWDTVFESPPRPLDARAQGGEQGLHYQGFSAMTVFQGRCDAIPCLYVGCICLGGAEILRSVDGEHFEVVGKSGMGNSDLLSFRTLINHAGLLFTVPAGQVQNSECMDRKFASDCILYVTDDPVNGEWVPAMEAGFGDVENITLTLVMPFAGHLYAGTSNPERGYQIWKTDLNGPPPWRWTPVLMDGAGRYCLNEAAISMAVFQNALYVGSGHLGLGHDKADDIGHAAELVRIYPDDDWDLIVGEPRFSPRGLKVPLSAMGPGFDDPSNSALWPMVSHGGGLYVGTQRWRPFGAMRSPPPVEIVELWASDDGEEFQPVLRDGFGDSSESGVRTLLSTPAGLFLGTSNHQGGTARLDPRASEVGGGDIWLARP